MLFGLRYTSVLHIPAEREMISGVRLLTTGKKSFHHGGAPKRRRAGRNDFVPTEGFADIMYTIVWRQRLVTCFST